MDHNTFVFDLQKEQSLSNDLVGGKGSNLCQIDKISGILVPQAFCVSTDAYRYCILQNPLINDRLRELSHPDITAVQTNESAQQIRSVIENTQLPTAVIKEISYELFKYHDQQLFAIRS
ncbi:MAG: PEP/pyruvate-binding domain-containing protein, partial [Flavitalea sp.]